MGRDIDNVIQRLFPAALIPAEAFEDWCSPIRESAQPGAADLIAKLTSALDSSKTECILANNLRRDCWELFGGDGDAMIKSTTSIRSKLARELIEEKIPKTETEETLHRKILEFSDLGRVRIVADFPSDIDFLVQRLLPGERFLDSYMCPQGIKDFIFDPSKRNGLKGHRARQFSVRVPWDENTDFGFEVQLMTRLQHAWDRRNHPLYEWQREKPDWTEDKKAVELAVNDFACAETLHLVDQQADLNWQRLQKLLNENNESDE